MYRSMHMKNGKVNVDIPQYLRRHDIVYKTPALKGYEGLPMGNGKCGGPVYHTANSLIYQINHTDAIDFARDGAFKAWAWESEEKSTAPFSCGKVSIISSQPVFDWVYLREFEERLDLADACLTGRALTPFSEIRYRMYAADKPNVTVLQVHMEQEEPTELTVRLEKWSTPNFFHHYEQVVRVHDKGLANTKSHVHGNIASVCHSAGGRTSALSVRAEGEEAQILRCSAHTCELRFAPASHHDFTLYISAEVAGDAGSAMEQAACNLKSAAETDPYKSHTRAWHDFWSRSFVHIEDDYIENLYYIHLYQLNACGRGKYPPLFGGLWTWFGDSRNWGHFYHWNHQQTYWGVYAAGHPELAENYLNYRFAMLKTAISDAKEWHNASGAFYSDISNLNEYNAPEPDTLRNFTVGPQIAMDFYRHYQYTGDEVFLEEKVIPVMRHCMGLYASLLEKGEDGLNRIDGGSTPYESYWNLRETLTDHAAIHALLNAVFSIEDKMGLSAEEAERYRDIQENLYDYATELITHNGEELRIFSAGQKWDLTPVKYGEGEYPLSPFPAALYSMVYPSGLIGLAQRNDLAFILARNTARVLLDNEVYALGRLGCSGHAPAPQMAARLGMGEDAGKVIRHYAQTYQIFPNGLMHFADISQNQQWGRYDTPRVLSGDETNTQWEEVHDKTKGNRTRISSEYFLHCYFEAAANLLDGLQESLLQSHDGVIRVFPATGGDENALFTLWAVGGFIVTAEKRDAGIPYVSVESTRGCDCRVENPWPGEAVRILCNGSAHDYSDEGGVLIFHTVQGERYLIHRAAYPPENEYADGFDYYQNPGPKHSGKVQIGLDTIY